MQKSIISWTGYTWNPTFGCSKVTDGCKHCYAETLALKFGQSKSKWTIQNEDENVQLKPHKLADPYRLKEPSRIFVNSMSDLFHRAVPDWYRAIVFCVMLSTPEHVYQVLTKRPELAEDWHERFHTARQTPEFREAAATAKNKRLKAALEAAWQSPWADHIWMGASIEDARVTHRLDSLRRNQAHVRFVSAEPLLGAWGAVDLTGIHWIIVGGESGQHLNGPSDPRWMKQEWAREIRDLCVKQGVAFFYKQDSGKRTELRPYLVEEDATRTQWHQFPGDMKPPTVFETGELYVMPGKPDDDPEPPTPQPTTARNQMRQDAVDAETRLREWSSFPEAPKDTRQHLKKGATVYAKEDIRSLGERIVPMNSKGIIENRGRYALNVKFDTYPHVVLCSWDMVTDKPVDYKDTPGYKADQESLKAWQIGGINDMVINSITVITPAPRPTRVVSFHDVKAHWDPKAQRWDSDEYVYIGRANSRYNLKASPFGNPFTLSNEDQRPATIERYRKHLLHLLEVSQVKRDELETLRGKTLVCWCSPKPCHGDVLLELLGERPPAQVVDSLRDQWEAAGQPDDLHMLLAIQKQRSAQTFLNTDVNKMRAKGLVTVESNALVITNAGRAVLNDAFSTEALAALDNHIVITPGAKAISLWEPYGTLIAVGAKQYETRHWKTSYRGDLVICTAKKRDREVLESYEALRPDFRRYDVKMEPMRFGVALCVATLVDCIPTELIPDDERRFGNFAPGRFAWLLENVRRFPQPLPVHGHQGLWTWEGPHIIESEPLVQRSAPVTATQPPRVVPMPVGERPVQLALL